MTEYIEPVWKMIKEVRTRFELPELLGKSGRHSKICEVGVLNGEHLANLMACIPDMAIGVDHFKKVNGTFERAVERCGVRHNCILLKMESLAGSRMFPDEFFDFIYIDAGHGLKQIHGDLRNWWPKLKTGGIFAGHDYAHIFHFKVIECVDDFVKQHGLGLHITDDEVPTWITVKE